MIAEKPSCFTCTHASYQYDEYVCTLHDMLVYDTTKCCEQYHQPTSIKAAFNFGRAGFGDLFQYVTLTDDVDPLDVIKRWR